jgi:RNA polymerase sigma-54 factor
MMKQRLELKLGQRLTMTPQLQQAIRLLQLPATDLHAEIAELLATNTLLEECEPGEGTEGMSELDYDPEPEDGGREVETATTTLAEDGSDWDAHYAEGTGGGSDDGRGDFIASRSAPQTLADHLVWQMHMTLLSAIDRRIGEALIDAIGADGYLCASLEEIREALQPEIEVGLDEVEMVLHCIQNFDPPGVGARSLSECLLQQLRQLDDDTPALAVARAVCEQHLDLLAGRDMAGLRRAIGCDAGTLGDAVDLIRSLNPRPGSAIASLEADYVVPDLVVERHGNRWAVRLTREACPRLRINADYEALLRERTGDQRHPELVEQMQEARWFLRSLHHRNDTLLQVARAIVARQSAWLEHGDQAMTPMVLNDIAAELELHESTISRATTRKYMRTPRGIVELKHFFSSRISTADGEGASATAIRSRIREIVDAEPPQRPISDSRIASLLAEQGFNVARRTVAKYRELMRIPPSSQRKPLIQADR